jgi:hypothetical protein
LILSCLIVPKGLRACIIWAALHLLGCPYEFPRLLDGYRSQFGNENDPHGLILSALSPLLSLLGVDQM